MPKQIETLYLDYVNNFLTIEAFASHYNISIDLANAIIDEGNNPKSTDRCINLHDIEGQLVANLMHTTREDGTSHLTVLHLDSMFVEVEKVTHLIK